MKTFDVQSIEILSPYEKAYAYIAEAANLPAWTNAFEKIDGQNAVMQTPNGSLEILLEVKASPATGCVDWIMTLPDQSVSAAYSRIIHAGDNRCIYSFILMAPPVPLEMLEGTLAQQSKLLTEELTKLKKILET